MNTPRYIRSEPRTFVEVDPKQRNAYRCVMAGQDAFSHDDGLGWVAACLFEFPRVSRGCVLLALRPGKMDVLDDRLLDAGSK